MAPDYNRTSSLWQIDADGKNLKEFLKLKEYSLSNPVFSPDGKTILFVMASGENFAARQTDIGTVGLKGEGLTNLTNDFDRDVQDFDWSSDGKTVYFRPKSDTSHGLATAVCA